MLAIQRFTATGAIDAAFNLYRRHFKVLFLISLIVNVPTTLSNLLVAYAQHHLESGALGLGAQGGADDPGAVGDLLPILGMWGGFFMLSLIVSLIASMFGTAAATDVASRAALGQRVDLFRALDAAKQVFWVLFATSLVTSLAFFLGSLFCFIPGLVLALGFAFIGPVIVLENVGVGEAIERSWFLTGGRRLKILGVWLLIGLIIGFANVGLALMVQFAPTLHGTLAGQLLQTGLSQAIAALGTPIWYVSNVLLYYDGRVDHEAFDVETLANTPAAEPKSSPRFEADVRRF